MTAYQSWSTKGEEFNQEKQMAKTKRLCRRSSRTPGMKDSHNFFSKTAWRKAKVRRKLQKAGRKAARNR